MLPFDSSSSSATMTKAGPVVGHSNGVRFGIPQTGHLENHCHKGEPCSTLFQSGSRHRFRCPRKQVTEGRPRIGQLAQQHLLICYPLLLVSFRSFSFDDYLCHFSSLSASMTHRHDCMMSIQSSPDFSLESNYFLIVSIVFAVMAQHSDYPYAKSRIHKA